MTIEVAVSTAELTLPDTNHREWAERAAKVDFPPLFEEPRRHAKSICDELDDPVLDDDPYSIALEKGAALAQRFLSDEIVEGLHLLKDGRITYLLIHNLPTGNLSWDKVLPPADGKRPRWKQDWTSEMTVLGTVQAGGLESLGYFDEAGGSLVQEVKLSGSHEFTNSELAHSMFHTDNAIHPRAYRAEGIALLGLINDCGAPAMVAPLAAILEQLTLEQIDVLSRERYLFSSPESFEYGRHIFSLLPRPVLTRGPGGEMEISAALHGTHVCCEREEVRMALDAFREVVVGPNDMLLMSNVTAMHTFGPVAGRRWLQRTYYRESLDALRSNSLTADTRLTRRFHTRAILGGCA
jgi:hypothetical protein